MKSTHVPKAPPETLPELAAFLEPFTPLFRRHTSRDSMERYVTGLLTDLPHKTADTIAATVAGTSTERLQHLLTDASWDATALDEARVKRLLALHPPSSGVLVFDDTGLPKKGLDPRTQVSMGGTVRLRIENERMHLFDTDTGKAIFY